MDLGTWFDQKVSEFKNLFSANPGLVSKGQFQLGGDAFKAVLKIVNDEIKAQAATPYGLQETFDAYKRDGFDKRARITAMRKMLTEPSHDAEYNKKVQTSFPNSVKAFAPDPGAKAWAKNQMNLLWGNPVISSPPALGTLTAEKVLEIAQLERSACFTATTAMAGKYLKARNKQVAFTTPPFGGVIAHAQVHDDKKATKPGRQTVTYTPSEFKDQVARIGDAISRGYVYRIGVTSGISHDVRPWPNPEHYLLLFAFDGSSRFLFWDSDTPRSDIKTRPQNGPGFNVARLINGHFSTANDEDDFEGINDDGDHLKDPARHRYQLYEAQPFPLPSR